MDMKKAMLAAMQEYLLPELAEIKSGQSRLEAELRSVNTRLDDVNQHLVDQSRRIDETNQRIDKTMPAKQALFSASIQSLLGHLLDIE